MLMASIAHFLNQPGARIYPDLTDPEASTPNLHPLK